MGEQNYFTYTREWDGHFTMDVCLDWYSQRLRVDDYRGNIYAIMERINLLAEKNSFTKAFVKAKAEHWPLFLAKGFMLEGVYSGYFRGSDAYCMAYYYDNSRRTSENWKKEDQILQDVLQMAVRKERPPLPKGFILRKAVENDLPSLASLYGQVFVSYPSPVHQVEYLQKMQQEGHLYYVIEHQGRIVSGAAAEVNRTDYNAEMTDCATYPEYRGKGLVRFLLSALEEELRQQQIYCCYSLARSLSFGMNAVLQQLGYSYSGRLTRNCKIVGSFEDMSLWVKNQG